MATKLGTLTLDLVARIGQFVEPMKKASSTVEREMQRATNSVNVMNGILGKLAATAGAAFSINQVKNYADSYTGMVNKLKLVTSTQSELSRAMDDTHKIAQATASDWNGVLDVYTKFQGLSKRLGIDQAEVARITETVTKTVSMSGQSAAASEAALLQFGQALNTGVLRGAELVSVMSQAPALAKALADGMGVAVGDLKKLGEEGKITSEVMRDALLKMSSSVDAEYAKTATTISASFNLITTEATKLIGEFDQAHGVSKTLVEGMTLVAENIGNITKVMMVAGAYMAGKYIALLTATAIGYVRNTVEVVRYQMALAGMQANAVGAARSLVLLRAASSAALGVLLSPVGLGVAVASVAAGYLLMKDSTDQSTKSLRENNESVDEAIKKYRELDEVRRRSQMVSEKEKLRDLGQEYDEVNSKLITATYSFSRHNDMTSEQSKQVNALIAEYKQTGDIDKFSQKINALSFISQNSKDKFNTLAGSVKTAGNEFKNQKSFVDQMAPAVKGVGDQAKQTAIEVANLSEEIKKLLNDANRNIKDAAITSALASRGYNDTMIELVKKYMAVEGAITTNAKGQQVLKDELKQKLREEYQAIMRSKNAVDDRNKSEEKTRKLIEAQGEAMKVNAKVAANAAKYNFAAIEAKNGLPAGLLSAIHMQESRGNPNAYNKSSGAVGGFQFLKSTAEQYGVKDRYNLAQSAEGAGKYMAYLLDLFKGDLDKAISAYHAGEGNVQRGTNIGPVNRQYVKNIKGYLGGSSGVAFTEEYSFDDWLKELEQHVAEQEKLEKELADKKRSIQVNYYDEWQKLEFDNQEKIKEINEAFASDPTERDRLLDLQQKAYGEDVANWIKAQDERVKAEIEANQKIILARQNAFAAMNGPLGAMVQMGVEASAKASMNPLEYQKWRMGNEQQDGYSQLADNLYSVREGIQNNEYLTDTEKYAQLNEAYRTYLESKKALTQEYAQQEADFAQYQHENQLSLYGSLLSQAGSVWGSMTQLVKDSAGESSAAYKAMFLAQQAIAIGQAIINTELGATKALAEGGMIMGVPAATMVRAMGYASVGLIAAQTIQGMAHNGIDNIPKEGTWLLDKGERVVDSRTNADLKDYLAKGGGSGGDVNITVHVTDSGVSTQSNQNEQKQLGQMIGNAVRTIIRQEQRQGGLLSK